MEIGTFKEEQIPFATAERLKCTMHAKTHGRLSKQMQASGSTEAKEIPPSHDPLQE